MSCISDCPQWSPCSVAGTVGEGATILLRAAEGQLTTCFFLTGCFQKEAYLYHLWLAHGIYKLLYHLVI